MMILYLNVIKNDTQTSACVFFLSIKYCFLHSLCLHGELHSFKDGNTR